MPFKDTGAATVATHNLARRRRAVMLPFLDSLQVGLAPVGCQWVRGGGVEVPERRGRLECLEGCLGELLVVWQDLC